MDNNTILFVRNFLFRTFLVGLVLAIILFVATVALRSVWLSLATTTFNLEEHEVSELVLGTFLHVRIILLFLILAPAIALHWMSKGKE